jgi:hypothetical protein
MKTDDVIVVLGLDADNKPRAAKFKKTDEKAARNLAVVQRFKLGTPKTDEAIEAATRLVDGRTFGSGKGLVPLVSPVAYEQLLKLLDIEDVKAEGHANTKPVAVPAASSKQAPSPNEAALDPWAVIAVGSAVLCPNDEKGKDRSWWECTVLAVAKDSLTVKWTHYPTFKRFKVKNGLVALLPAKK